MSTSSPVKASPTQAFVKPTKQAVAANRPSAVSSNNRSQSTAAVPTQRSSDSKPQKANFKTRSPNLMSSPETEGPSIFFPGSSSSGGCPTHHRHSMEMTPSSKAIRNFKAMFKTCSTKILLPTKQKNLLSGLSSAACSVCHGYFRQPPQRDGDLEVTAHRVADEKPGVAEAYKALAPELREALYQNIEKAAEELLVKDFALLTIYDADLASVKSEAVQLYRMIGN
ncbi:hypothetical protein BKA70DRAFT_1242266 [Coprinopsis sp. MPI-PUGE-AT-0042]|nr:hypothetical protein BKA70DRAFT_1242266 [Coprinopsis sp. MPI-PUGE-AT-0042]